MQYFSEPLWVWVNKQTDEVFRNVSISKRFSFLSAPHISSAPNHFTTFNAFWFWFCSVLLRHGLIYSRQASLGSDSLGSREWPSIFDPLPPCSQMLGYRHVPPHLPFRGAEIETQGTLLALCQWSCIVKPKAFCSNDPFPSSKILV